MHNRLSITAIEEGAPRAPLVLRGDLVTSVQRAASFGYGALEIHVIDASTFPIEKLKAALKKNGICISSIVTGQIFTRRHLCITSSDPKNRAAAMSEVKDYIDIAAALDAADGVVIGWVKGNHPDGDRTQFDALLAEQLGILSVYAKEKGQRILIEVINRYETNLFNTAAELKTFIQKWGLQNCFIHLDTFHMNIDEADMSEAIRTAGKDLGYFHLADSNRLALGCGHISFDPLFATLQEVGYQGSISLECIPEPDSVIAAEKSRTFLSKYLG
jgi:sugar phosphate isomerase/epimerase